MIVHAIDLVITALWFLGGLVLTLIGIVDGALAMIMSSVGLDPEVQIIVLGVFAVVLVIASIRILSVPLSILLFLLLVLLLIHKVVPDMHMPVLPANLGGTTI